MEHVTTKKSGFAPCLIAYLEDYPLSNCFVEVILQEISSILTNYYIHIYPWFQPSESIVNMG